MAANRIVSELFNVVRFSLDRNSQAEAEAALKKVQGEAKKDTEAKIKPGVDQKASNEALNELQKLKSTAIKLLSFIGISVGLSNMNQIIEAYGEINDKIKNASDGLADQEALQKEILDSANECRQSYESFGNYVASIAKQNSDLFPIDEATQFAKLLSQNEIGTGNASNLTGVQNILSGVISSGKLSNTVFAQLKKSAPEVLDVLEKGLGKTEKQLETMAAGGTLTAEKVKEAYISSADTIGKKYEQTAMSVTDAITIVNNRFGKKITEINDKFKITDKVANAIVKAFGVVEKVLDGISSGMEKLSKFTGGVDNALKLIALAVASIFLAWKGPKIIEDIKKMMSIMKPANLKIAAIAAALLAIFLLVEDFVGFLQGKDSVFGKLLEGAGIDADEAREKILTFFSNVKQKAQDVIKSVGKFWQQHKGEVKAVFDFLWGVIQFVFNKIVSTAQKTISKAKEWWSKYGDDVISIFNSVKEIAGVVYDWISEKVGAVVSAIKEWWNTYGEDVTSALQSGYDAICNISQAMWDIFGGAIAFVADLLKGDFPAAFDDLKETVNNVLNDINSFFQNMFGIDILGAITGFVDAAKEALGEFFGWISDHFPALSGLINGISSFTGIDVKSASVDNAVSAGKTETTNNNAVTQNNYNTFNVTDRTAAASASDAIKKNGRSLSDQVANELAHAGR